VVEQVTYDLKFKGLNPAGSGPGRERKQQKNDMAIAKGEAWYVNLFSNTPA
jgi:hypothetical protein